MLLMAEHVWTTSRSLRRQHHRRGGVPKRAFATLAEAERFRLPGLEIYLCGSCRQWHLGSSRVTECSEEPNRRTEK